MLELLDKLDGVKSAMANHTGSLIRVQLEESADSDSIAAELHAILNQQRRMPKRLVGEEIAKAVTNETWRTVKNIGELSEIEFRTVFERRVKQFVDASSFDESTAEKLLEFAAEVLDETPPSNQETDWSEFCDGLTSRMIEKAKALLNEQQLKELARRLTAQVVG